MLTTRLKVGSKVSAPLSLKGGLCRASQVVALVQVKQDQVAVASSTCSDVQQRAREGEAQCPSHAFFCCWHRGRTQGNANGVILERAAITIKALQGISTRIAMSTGMLRGWLLAVPPSPSAAELISVYARRTTRQDATQRRQPSLVIMLLGREQWR